MLQMHDQVISARSVQNLPAGVGCTYSKRNLGGCRFDEKRVSIIFQIHKELAFFSRYGFSMPTAEPTVLSADRGSSENAQENATESTNRQERVPKKHTLWLLYTIFFGKEQKAKQNCIKERGILHALFYNM